VQWQVEPLPGTLFSISFTRLKKILVAMPVVKPALFLPPLPSSANPVTPQHKELSR